MKNNKDLEIIKDNFGENFMRLCRSLFPSILETEGLLSKIILDHFAPTRSLVENLEKHTEYYFYEYENIIEDFKEYIFSFVNIQKETPTETTQKTPEQLLMEAGYILYPECKTEEDIQAFRKYYKEGEKLCTFNGGRLRSCRVWFAVKKDVDAIKRENFEKPERQDEYGTSVISIQFTKGANNILSIKNRYNHSVNNPDATFSNNLDNIIPGLTDAFKKEYGINIIPATQQNLEIPGYILCGDGKYYKWNYEINGHYFCENNILIEQNGKVKKFDKNNFLLFDKYILDFQEKKLYSLTSETQDNFCDIVKDIKKIDVVYELDKNQHKTENKIITITPEVGAPVIIKIDKCNRMIEYTNPNIKELPDNCFRGNKFIKKISMPNLEKCGKGCFNCCRSLKEIDVPNLTICDEECFYKCYELSKINFQKLESCGEKCFYGYEFLTSINLPNLKTCGNSCFSYIFGLEKIKMINLPILESCGDECFYDFRTISDISLPELKTCGNNCFKKCSSLITIDLKKLKMCENNCFYNCKLLTTINLPELKTCKDGCFKSCELLKNVNISNIIQCGNNCFCDYKSIKILSLHNLAQCGTDCFCDCTLLETINVPNLNSYKKGCFKDCYFLENINIKKSKNIWLNIKNFFTNKKINQTDNSTKNDVSTNTQPQKTNIKKSSK